MNSKYLANGHDLLYVKIISKEKNHLKDVNVDGLDNSLGVMCDC